MAKLNPNQRIYDVLREIENPGTYRIPNIQRGYEWDRGRIAKLLDSIMNGYPIGAIMVWKPTAEVQADISDRRFVKDFKSDEDYLSDAPHAADVEAYLVLDGQQRLQSLYLSFFGSYDGRRVYMAIDHLPSPDADDEDYDFQFLTADEAKSKANMIPLVKIVELDADTKDDFTVELAEKLAGDILDDDERRRMQSDKRRKIARNIDRFVDKFNVTPALLIQEVSSRHTYDDVLEIFERVNSGGMVLSKSDLLFSTLKLKLKDKEEDFRKTLNDINHGERYGFNTDFVIKASLVVFGKGAKYDVKKLRDESYVAELQKNYTTLDKCLRQLVAWLDETALVKCDRFLSSKLALIPLIDYMMLSGKHEKPDGDDSRTMKEYLHMAFFTRLFGRSSDAMLDKIHKLLVASLRGDPAKGVAPKLGFPIGELRSLISERTRAPYGLYRHFLWGDAAQVLNLLQGGVLQIDPQDPNKHPKDLRLEVDHIFPRAKLNAAGMADIANHYGNYRLVVLPVNRRKSAKWPNQTTDFIGRNDPGVSAAFEKCCGNFSRDTYQAFIDARSAVIARGLEQFMNLKFEAVSPAP